MKIFFKALFVIGIIYYSTSCTNNDTPRCELLPKTGPCEAAIPKYYFDQEEQKCKEFLWGGCDGIVPFDTLEDCKECE